MKKFSKISIDGKNYLLLLLPVLGINLVYPSFKEFGFSFYTANTLATVQGSWLNLFTGAMDIQGFQAVDKPPLAYLLQGILGKLFGLNSLTLMLPSALYLWLSAIVIYKITKNVVSPLREELKLISSEVISFIAAILFVLTPVVVLHNRDNLADPLETLALVLMLHLGIKLVIKPRRNDFLLLGAVTGLSFLTKVGLLLPAFLLILALVFYFAPGKRFFVITHSFFATIVAMLPYAFFVFWYDVLLKNPPRLVSGKSQLDLLLNFNSFSRLPWSDPKPTWFGFPKYKLVGLDRLLRENYIDSWFWILPLALAGISLLLLAYRGLEGKVAKRNLKKSSSILLTTLLINFLILSFSGSKVCCTHPYYSILLVPTLAIFGAIGLNLIANLLTERKKIFVSILTLLLIAIAYKIALSEALLLTLKNLLAPYDFQFWLSLVVIVIVLGILVKKNFTIKSLAIYILLFTLTLPMTLISLATVSNPAIQTIGADQRAGRNTFFGVNLSNYKEQKVTGLAIKQLYPNGRIIENMTFTLATPSQISPTLKQIVDQLPSTVTWKLITLDSFNASLLYLATKQPVLAVGGGSGLQEVISFKEFLKLVSQNEVGYFVLDPHALCMVNPNLGATVENGSSSALILDWVTKYGIRAVTAGELDTTLPVLFKLPSLEANSTLKEYASYHPTTGKYITGIEHCEKP